MRRAIRTAASIASQLADAILSLAELFRGFLRFRDNYIVARWTGDRSLAYARRIAIFCHYDRRGRVHDYVLHYLSELLKAGFEIIFVSNSSQPIHENLRSLLPLCGLVLHRKNLGYDFGAYKDGFFAVPELSQLDELIFANDSVYGPFCDLAPLLARCDDSAAIWGITDSWDRRFHLQTYFLLFKKRALSDPRILDFWHKVRYFQSKRLIIQKYEINLTQEAIRGGLRCSALFPHRQVAEAVTSAVINNKLLQREDISEQHRAYLLRVFEAIDRGAPLNVSHFFWDYLIGELGCPFIKRELLMLNPVNVPFLQQWRKVIERATSYDADLIARHLEATLRNRAL